MVLCGLALAQETTTPQTNSAAPQDQQSPVTSPSAQARSGQASGAPRIAPGSITPVQLTKSIDAKKVKTGDEVEARVTQDLKAGNGELVVSKDTKVGGHVTEVQARSKEQKESQVGIAFDHAVMKNGGDMTLPMSIQAIIAPPTLNADNNNAGSQQSAGQPASAPSGARGRYPGTGARTPPHSPSSATARGPAPTSAPA